MPCLFIFIFLLLPCALVFHYLQLFLIQAKTVCALFCCKLLFCSSLSSVLYIVYIYIHIYIMLPFLLGVPSKWKISFQNILCHLKNNILSCFCFSYITSLLSSKCWTLLLLRVCVCWGKSFVVCPIWFLYIFFLVSPTLLSWNEFFFPVDVFNGVCFYNFSLRSPWNRTFMLIFYVSTK